MAVYDRALNAAYASSNGYYGYVPPCTRGQFPAREDANCEPVASAMETDEEDVSRCGLVALATRRLSNRCVIPEAVQEAECRQPRADADGRRRSRKRCIGDCGPVRELKRSREGGGNGRVYYGTGSSKGYRGLAEVRYGPAPLCLGKADGEDDLPERDTLSFASERCCWPAVAGNRSLSKPGLKCSLPSDKSVSLDSDPEYERMLFETHGCSAYHHCWLQFSDNDHCEF